MENDSKVTSDKWNLLKWNLLKWNLLSGIVKIYQAVRHDTPPLLKRG